jgi:hypothetical protein
VYLYFSSTNTTVEQHIIALSLAHKILSPYTAFFGVEATRSGKSLTSQDRSVPILISKVHQQPTSLPNIKGKNERVQTLFKPYLLHYGVVIAAFIDVNV